MRSRLNGSEITVLITGDINDPGMLINHATLHYPDLLGNSPYNFEGLE